jgi:uncharacterized membrane protein
MHGCRKPSAAARSRSFDQEIAVSQIAGSGQRQQRGAVMVFAAIGLSVVVIMLSLADIGFLYYYKREYQKAADLAAMAGARKLVSPVTGVRSCDDNARPAATDNAARNLGGRSYSLQVECGRWEPRAATPDNLLDTTVATDELDAVRAIISGAPPRFLPFAPSTAISARAIALADQPLAQLRIRSTLLAVDTQQSELLNGVVGGLLGGSISLPVAAWNGLLNTDINLLNYLDALALELGLSAGDYDQVLGANLTLGQMLEVAADVLSRGGGTGEISAAVSALNQLLGYSLPGYAPLVQVGDLIGVQTGTPSSGADVALNLLQLVQGGVQLANSACAVCANLPVDLPGVAGVQVRSKVLQPPQLSAIGNPALAAVDPLGPDRIFVRTAQVRTLVSVDLPISGGVLSGLQSLLNDTVVAGITTAVNDLLSLNLLGLLESLSCLVACNIERELTDILVLPTPRVDLNLDAGGGQSYVTDHECASSGKSLTTPTRTSAAELRIGQMGSSAENAADNVFSSAAPPSVEPIPLIDIGHRRVRYQCTLQLICTVSWWRESPAGWVANKSDSTRYSFSGGGIGVKAEVPVAASDYNQLYTDPPTGGLPELGKEPAWQAASSSGVVNSLYAALQGLELQFYEPASGSGITGSGLGSVLFLVGSAADTLVDALMDVISDVLSPLLDPLLDFLVDALGIDLSQVEVGANLSCDGGGATLVN